MMSETGKLNKLNAADGRTLKIQNKLLNFKPKAILHKTRKFNLMKVDMKIDGEITYFGSFMIWFRDTLGVIVHKLQKWQQLLLSVIEECYGLLGFNLKD